MTNLMQTAGHFCCAIYLFTYLTFSLDKIMKFLHVIMFFCFLVVCMEASEVLEVSGHVGGEVSIYCSGSWNRDNSAKHNSMYFCKGVCSSENILIQTERMQSTVIRQGRYSIKNGRGDGVFNVAIKKLEKADAGRYRCGVEKTLLYREINLIVLDASTVPGSPPSITTILQTKTALLSQDSFTPSTEQSPAASSPSDGKRNRQEVSRLTDTTMVIIVSGSLALLVCAIIPVIFYGHWRSNAEGTNRAEDNKGEGDHCEQNADVTSAQVEVGLQAFEPEVVPETDGNISPNAAVYQAMDPQALN